MQVLGINSEGDYVDEFDTVIFAIGRDATTDNLGIKKMAQLLFE